MDLTGVISLPAGVFNPYSGVKTSILIIDKLKKSDQVFYLEVTNDGYSLTTNRTQISESDLPNILNQIKSQKIKKENYIAIDEINEDNNYKLTKTKEIYVDSDYQLVPITDVAFFQEGPGILSKEYRENGYPIVNVKCVQDGYLKLDDTKFVGEEIANGKWNHFKVEKDDILFTTSGTIGRVSKVSSEDLPLLMNTSVVRFRTLDENKLKNNFLYTVLRSQKFKEELLSFQTGSAQKNVGPTHIKKIKIPLPPLEKQKEIVDEIEQYQKVIDGARQVVENYKPAIDIEPDWEMIELQKISQVGSSKRIFKKEYINSGVPFYRTKEIVELEKGENISLELFISDSKYQEIKNKFSVPKLGDILISAVGTIGISWVVNTNEKFYFKDGNLLWLKDIDENYIPEFVKYAFDGLFKTQKNKIIHGAAYNALTIQSLKKFKIPNISIEAQKKLVDKINLEKEIINGNKLLIKINNGKIDNLVNSLYTK
jgi:restriction endonuclease S subunit